MTQPADEPMDMLDTLPRDWGLAEGRCTVHVAVYRVFLGDEAELARGPRVVDLFGARIVFAHAAMRGVRRPTETPFDSQGRLRELDHPGYFRVDGPVCVVHCKLGFEPTAEEDRISRETRDQALAMVRLLLGRNAAFEFVTDYALRRGRGAVESPVFENPADLPRPRLSEDALAEAGAMALRVEALPSERRARTLLALRWLGDAHGRFGVDGYLFRWIAVEVLAMEGSSLTPLVQVLGRAYGSSEEEVRRQLHVGRLFHLRSTIAHGGTPDIDGRLMDYVEAVFVDALHGLLGLRSSRAADFQRGFDVAAVLRAIGE